MVVLIPVPLLASSLVSLRFQEQRKRIKMAQAVIIMIIIMMMIIIITTIIMMMMIIIIVIIMIIIIIIILITFKGANRDFCHNLLTAPRTISKHARSSGSGAVVCKSRATHRPLITCNMSCYVPHGTKGQLSY